ncbi:MAG: DUF6600 domain-containing protein, partial [Thermoanaerobaculia bacterium]|nr:DUF6600 domain-containing protein [Thermoanaerobaculia bacterium]
MSRSRFAAPLLLASALPVCAAVPASAQSDRPPAYLRVIEGDVSTSGEGTDPVGAQQHAAVAPGEILELAAGSRVEVVLGDGSRIRAEGPGALAVDDTAAEPVVEVGDGEIQVRTLAQDAAADVAARFLTVSAPGADVYLAYPGEYRISARGGLPLVVTVRDGWAETVAGRRSFVVRRGESARIDAGEWPEIELAAAPAADSLEEWASWLEREAGDGRTPWVDEELQYAAAPLADHGSWLAVDGAAAWAPRADASWQPYDAGHWSYVDGGMFWVSYEPWGWLPYHYGAWDLHPQHGWLWYPGRYYAGAHVTFHWGSSWVGWTPTRYYHRHDRYRGYGRWAHASQGWRRYGRRCWVYSPRERLGSLHQSRFHEGHGAQRQPSGPRQSGYDIVSDDTRGLTPDTWRDPSRTGEVVAQRRAVPRAARDRDRGLAAAGGSRPQRSAFTGSSSFPRSYTRTGLTRRTPAPSSPSAGSRPGASGGRSATRSPAATARAGAPAGADLQPVRAPISRWTRSTPAPGTPSGRRAPVSRRVVSRDAPPSGAATTAR